MSSPAAEPAAATFRLMYRSRSRIPSADRKLMLGQLFSQARSNNKRRGVTGALLLTEDWFVQVLEGDEAEVRGIYERISGDDRHDSVTLLESGTVDGRTFSRWAMARVSEDGAPDIPLIAHADGISPAAAHRTDSRQDRVLRDMRVAAQLPTSG